jgi:hypothetical protein
VSRRSTIIQLVQKGGWTVPTLANKLSQMDKDWTEKNNKTAKSLCPIYVNHQDNSTWFRTLRKSDQDRWYRSIYLEMNIQSMIHPDYQAYEAIQAIIKEKQRSRRYIYNHYPRNRCFKGTSRKWKIITISL